jgi:hypothetical protein
MATLPVGKYVDIAILNDLQASTYLANKYDIQLV